LTEFGIFEVSRAVFHVKAVQNEIHAPVMVLALDRNQCGLVVGLATGYCTLSLHKHVVSLSGKVLYREYMNGRRYFLIPRFFSSQLWPGSSVLHS
jgi:hypothetical protein